MTAAVTAAAASAAALDAAAAVAARALPAFADVTLKATLVLAVAHVITRWGMRHAAAATRHLVWSAAVTAVLALPVLAAVAPRWTAPVVPDAARRLTAAFAAAAAPAAPAALPNPAPPGVRAPAAAPAAGAAVANAARATGAADRAAPPGAPAVRPAAATPALAANAAAVSAPAASPPARPLVLWAAAAWAAGALAVLARLVLGTVGLARLVRRARPADDPAWVMPMQRLARELGVRRPVTLLVGRTGTVPVTWGVVYPVVLLPADAAEWGAERRRLVLLHELAHVERLDALTQALAQLATALFWFNPLVTLAARRLRAERERACDDLVLAAGGVRATAYADDLLDLVRTLGDASPAAAALAMARRSEFEGRLLAILDPRAPRARTSARRALAAAALAAAVAVPLAGMRPGAAPVDVAPAGVAQGAPVVAADGLPNGSGGIPRTHAPTAAAPGAATAHVVVLPPAAPLGAGRRARAATSVDAAGGAPRARGAAACDATPASGVSAGSATTYRAVDDARCLEVRTYGAVDFGDDYADVRAVAPGGRFVAVEARAGEPARRLEIAPAAGGALARRYTVGGAARPPAEGAGWLRALLDGPVRRSGLGVDARAARLRRDGGAAAVLAAARGADDNTRRRLLEALLAGPALAPAELEQVALAARTLAVGSRRAAVLGAVAARAAGSPAVAAAVVDAARGIPAGADRRRVLEQTSQDPALPPAVVADLARAAAGIPSDGDREAVLVRLAPRVGASEAARAAFFDAVQAFASDGSRQRVLLAAVAAPGDARMLAPALDAVAPMASDAGRAEVLAAVAARRPFADAAVRTRYFAAVDATASESARERALLAAVAEDPRDEAVRAVLASAGRLTSDRTRADVLLGVAARTDALRRPDSRAAFLAALRPMTSSAEYRRVMEAVVPR